VGIRPKLFLIILLFGILPMLGLSIFSYFSGVNAIRGAVASNLTSEAANFSRETETSLKGEEDSLLLLASDPRLKSFVAGRSAEGLARNSNSLLGGPSADDAHIMPSEVAAILGQFYDRNREAFLSLTIFDAQHRSLGRFYAAPSGNERSKAVLKIRTALLPDQSTVDSSLWSEPDPSLIRSGIVSQSSGSTVRLTAPIFVGASSGSGPRGAVVYEVLLDPWFRGSAHYRGNSAPVIAAESTNSGPGHNVLVLDPHSLIVFHTSEALAFQPADRVMPPQFKSVADSMISGQKGVQTFIDREGRSWMVAYNPIPSIQGSVAAMADVDSAMAGLKRDAVLTIGVAIILGLITAIVSNQIVKRMTRSIEHVTAGAVAIAAGDLNQRIEVTSSDETRLLAESFNRMTDRLKEQIGREAETRQFESFMRLSAMLTHDLKNAIAALSLLVGNIEKQFDREEFRRDAMQSLLESTEKLRGIVKKLSGPVQSLSGEHEMPRPANLVPLIKRVLVRHALLDGSPFHVVTRMPDQLIAVVEQDRIEKVVENLVINAVEAMGHDGGTLTIEAGETENNAVFFTVQDTGPGMSDDFQRAKLFRAFSTTKRYGVGLGLYTCREVVKAHGGYIDVKSTKGDGTTFRVVLPSPAA
jgi:signal transduction histidine kinase